MPLFSCERVGTSRMSPLSELLSYRDLVPGLRMSVSISALLRMGDVELLFLMGGVPPCTSEKLFLAGGMEFRPGFPPEFGDVKDLSDPAPGVREVGKALKRTGSLGRGVTPWAGATLDMISGPVLG
jgi:hypothetical protein